MDATPINFALMLLRRRAEGAADPAMLVETFVEAGPLFTLLQNPDHQLIYGRHGTGKTHALKYLAQEVVRQGYLAVYVDMRTVGSNVSLYNNLTIPVTERGTRLLDDVLTSIHGQLAAEIPVLAKTTEFDFPESIACLNALIQEITTVRVDGDVEHGFRTVDHAYDESRTGVEGTVSLRQSVHESMIDDSHEYHGTETTVKLRGPQRLHVSFGAIHELLARLIKIIPAKGVWILLDEWIALPSDLQPLLADLLKRSIFTVPGVTVKIAAQHSSRFGVTHDDRSYTGIRIGVDAAADIDLDESLTFENNPVQSQDFFKKLLFRHVRATLIERGRESDVPASANEFVSEAFVDDDAFAELVRAAEGIPRDAINLSIQAAQTAINQPISVPVVRGAALRYYQQDKEDELRTDPRAFQLLHEIQDKVIGTRRSRGFYLDQNESDHPMITALYNARVIHLVRRGVSTYVQPGIRYNVYAIDYGAYVELQSTDKEVLGLCEAEGENGLSYVEVPNGNFRSIERAILRLSDFPLG